MNRDKLFSGNPIAEKLLKRIVALLASSHYKNSPNDLLLLCDSPKHELLLLLPPRKASFEEEGGSAAGHLPDILAVLQVVPEGNLSMKDIESYETASRGVARPDGDLIPWTLSQQFASLGGRVFGGLFGYRIQRVAVDHTFQRKGYGSCAVKSVCSWLEGRIQVAEGKTVYSHDSIDRPLLVPTSQHVPFHGKLQTISYIGTSFGMTVDLFKFWNTSLGFKPVYIRQGANEITGENSCIMIRAATGKEDRLMANNDHELVFPVWLAVMCNEFNYRFLRLLSGPMRSFDSSLALAISTSAGSCSRFLGGGISDGSVLDTLNCKNIFSTFTRSDLERLHKFGVGQLEYGLVADLASPVASAYFAHRFKPEISHQEDPLQLTALQRLILLMNGLQGLSFDQIALIIGMPVHQLMALFSQTINKIAGYLEGILEKLEN